MNNFDKNEATQKMKKSIDSFKKDLGTLRTGRANPAMLDLIRIDVYGQKMPINQLYQNLELYLFRFGIKIMLN